MRKGKSKRPANSLPIKAQLFLIVSLLAVFAAGIIVYSGIQRRNEVFSEARQQVRALATTIAVQQQGLVAATEQLLSVLSKLPDLRNRDAASLAGTLGKIIEMRPEYSTIFVTDPAGEIWCSALPTRDQKIQDRESFARALANRRFTAGRYRKGQYSGRQILSFYYPYYDDKGALSGAIILGIDLVYHRRLLGNYQMPPLANYLLLDHNGTILSGGEDHDFAGQSYEPGAFSRMKDGPETDTVVAIAHDGRKRLISHRKLRLASEQAPYLYVRAGVPIDSVLARANRMLVVNLGIFMAALLVVFRLAWVVGKRSITDRVDLLERSALKLAEGDLTVRVADLVSGGELGNLASALDHMALQLSLREQDLKKSHATLRQSEQFIRSILDAVDEGFLVIDRDYRIVTANRAYCEQVRCPEGGVVGRTCHELSHGSDRPCFELGETCAVRGVFETGEPQTALYRQLDAGAVRYLETKAFPLRDASGAVVSAIETVANVTEKLLLEEERLKTQKLESIGTLAGGIAHDFNNLLQGVFGFVSLAKVSLDSRELALSMLEQAEQALHQSVGLTMQLLTFAKGGKPVRKPTVLRPLIESAVKLALSGSRVDFSLEIEEGLPAVEVDPGQIAQVIQNIVLNACQSMPEGGTIRVRAAAVQAPSRDVPAALAPGAYIVVEISDSGIGIPARHLRRIFDPYFTTKERGSGLGLASAFSIVRNHGGLIDVHSEPGRGSTFRVYLAAVPAVEPQARAALAQTASRTGRILLMDDEEIVRSVTVKMLAALGHTVTAVERGEAAVEAWREAREQGRPFDLAILDLTIRGGMGGQETLRRLREMEPAVTAVASSGYSDDAAVAAFRAQGFAAFLKKPYLIQELQETLNRLLA